MRPRETRLLVSALLACLALVLMDGWTFGVSIDARNRLCPNWHFDPSDAVMISLVAAVTIQAIGVYVVIVRSVFPPTEDA